MYQEHQSFTSPDDQDAKIWKYLDFTKFISMLETDSLYFARADKRTPRTPYEIHTLAKLWMSAMNKSFQILIYIFCQPNFKHR